MNITQVRSEAAIELPKARSVDMKLEVVVIPVSDVDRAKRFYSKLGWRLDADFVVGDAFRGRAVHAARLVVLDPLRHGHHVGRAGLGTGLYLVVSDIEAARAELSLAASTWARCSTVPPGKTPAAARIRRGEATPRTRRSAIRTATAGCSRRSPRDCPGAWTPTRRHSRRRVS